MSVYEDIKLEGHIIDSLLLPQVLDVILGLGGEYRILRFNMGMEKDDPSLAVLRVTAAGEAELDEILRALQQHGAELIEQTDAALERCPADSVFPEDFYSTTNLETFIRFEGRWIPVDGPEMDCGVRVDQAASPKEFMEVDAEFTQRQAYQEGSLTEPPDLSIYQDPP